jgi:hypothetical protein
MRLAAYQFTTSGGFADSTLRICVFHASRSTTVRSTVRPGCSASNSAASCSITARGPGFDMSEKMRSSPERSWAAAAPGSIVAAASAAAPVVKMDRMVSSL